MLGGSLRHINCTDIWRDTMKSPKAPKKTAEQVAVERRQTMLLDKEIQDEETRFRQLSRGKLGKASLLASAGGKTRGAPAAKASPTTFTGAGYTGGGFGGYGSYTGAGRTTTGGAGKAKV